MNNSLERKNCLKSALNVLFPTLVSLTWIWIFKDGKFVLPCDFWMQWNVVLIIGVKILRKSEQDPLHLLVPPHHSKKKILKMCGVGSKRRLLGLLQQYEWVHGWSGDAYCMALDSADRKTFYLHITEWVKCYPNFQREKKTSERKCFFVGTAMIEGRMTGKIKNTLNKYS